jgi:membrane fusion protein, multidrug efflux system
MRSSYLLTTIGAALLVTGCGDTKPSASEVVKATPVPVTATAPGPGSSVSPVREDAEDSAIVVSGPIIVEHQLDLTAQRDGVIAKIYFDTPSRVRAGVLLAQMDDRQLTANLEACRAKSRSIEADLKNWESETEVLKADYVRAQHLSDLGLISEEQLQHAKFKVDSDQWDAKRVAETLNTSRNEERSLELELEKTRITTPFDSLVARRYVHEGQSVSRGDRLFWVTSEAPLLMRFTLPERYFGHVRAVQQFEVSSPDAPGEKHQARVKEVSPVIDPSSGTFEVLVELTGDRGSLRPGMTANLRVEKSRQAP